MDMLQVSWLVLLSFLTPPDTFQAGVRPTEPLTVEAERQSFHLPPGFSVTCFAAEPDIQKPMNMAFDGRGRLWVTGSVEYPYAVADGAGRDTIKILEDTDRDGRADQVTNFAEGLNIPMGLYPYRDGVVVYNQPHIWFLRDTDGDDRADQREILYADLGKPQDTHGMQNAFRRGNDGWLYICHGFANHSVVRGRDGSQIVLDSGNTYRVRLDGSRVEQYTFGQVNPFGMGILPNGDMITADCHSKPLSLLLRGGYYPSFGRPDDGLGFVPDLMSHSHGSTAIAGVAVPTGDKVPQAYRNSLLVGNVMTSRVHWDQLVYRGATPKAVEQTDFLVSDDPWFRPVDLQFGPDDGLYIADFYNKIIGHYEVPLDHPERDRHRGRIWRIATRRSAETQIEYRADTVVKLSHASIAELIASLGSENLTIRMLAADQLSDRYGTAAVESLRNAARGSDQRWLAIHASWVLLRLHALTPTELDRLAASNDPVVRIHAMRMLGERPVSDEVARRLAHQGVRDTDPQVRRLAAEACGTLCDPQLLGPLVQVLEETPSYDTHLAQSVRIAIRNVLQNDVARGVTQLRELSPTQRLAVVDILVAVPSAETAELLLQVLDHAPTHAIGDDARAKYLAFVANHLSIERTDAWIGLAKTQMKSHVPLQFRILRDVLAKLKSAKRPIPTSVVAWGRELVAQVYPVPGATNQWICTMGDNPWGIETRNCDNGDTNVPFVSSLPGGEKSVSTLRSPTFTLPASFAFQLCGHRGFPGNPASEANQVRLCLAEGDQVIEQAFPPRSDIAVRVTWDLTEFAGQTGYLEVVDGLDHDAYAWLAIAGIDSDLLPLPTLPAAHQAELLVGALTAIEHLQLHDYLAEVRTSLIRSTTPEVAAASARAAVVLSNDTAMSYVVADLIGLPTLSPMLRRRLADGLADPQADRPQLVAETMMTLDYATQRLLADRLSSSADLANYLAQWMEEGRMSPELLQSDSLWSKVTAVSQPALLKRWHTLRENLVPVELSLVEKIPKVVDAARGKIGSLEAGAALFQKNCSACHKVGDRGNLVGPQLDGIGSRGMQRLAEDILLPNRNVDQAFRVSIVALDNGQVVTGLKRRDEGSHTVFANDKGEEFRVAHDTIEEIRTSSNSLMPDGFARTLSEDELATLLAYIASLTK